jgi:hypothetical protein
VLQVLPFGDPAIGDGAAAVGALVEVGQRVVEVAGVDVVEDLPEDLAVFELVPCRDSAGQFECVDLCTAPLISHNNNRNIYSPPP